jgi:hypothetical protein
LYEDEVKVEVTASWAFGIWALELFSNLGLSPNFMPQLSPNLLLQAKFHQPSLDHEKQLEKSAPVLP